ncbi:MAG: hypothetical protein DME26_19265 [Verrucomicrobia bacterium]|nr:MAG: hypothetical protein DME26_19265 [Verrucomicrobiota bacterium]
MVFDRFMASTFVCVTLRVYHATGRAEHKSFRRFLILEKVLLTDCRADTRPTVMTSALSFAAPSRRNRETKDISNAMNTIRSQTCHGSVGGLPGTTGKLGRLHLDSHWVAVVVVMVALAVSGTLWAGPIPVPNGSFELQVAGPPFGVDTRVDSWQKPPKPTYFDETAFGITWDQTAGVFVNTPVGQANHIDNMDGNQGAYMLAFPQVALFQDYNSTDWNHPSPPHDFNAIFQVGMSYKLTVSVIGGGGGMPEGTSMQLSLYYRDGASNMVTVAATPIIHSLATFPTNTHFVDFEVNVPTIQAGDAWAGQNIGIQLLSAAGTGQGYWDVDNVRLLEVPEPAVLVLLVLGLGGMFVMRPRLCRRL